MEPKDEPSAEQYELVEPRTSRWNTKWSQRTSSGTQRRKWRGDEDHHNGKKKRVREEEKGDGGEITTMGRKMAQGGFPNSHAVLLLLTGNRCCAVDDLDDCYLTTDDVVDQLKLVEY